MIIGVPKEIKNNENRVSLTPGSIATLVKHGHKVLVETTAGVGSGFSDEEYKNNGATVYTDKQKLFNDCDLIVKVKEPLEEEYDMFKEGQGLYTYLHLAPNKPLTLALLKKKVAGIAYETVEFDDHRLPLLTPMSEVAGRMSVQIGATLLQKYNGGKGVLLGGVPGVSPAKVVIIGAGEVGTNAAKMAMGLGADVTMLDVNQYRLRYLNDVFGARIKTIVSTHHNIEKEVKDADLVIGAVLVIGAAAPKLVTTEMVKQMSEGAVIVDVAIDQGGSVETIDRVTTHDNPSYTKYGVVHYSVANMPGAVPRTSTFALEAATLPYLIKIANKGIEKALLEDHHLMKGLNTYKGHITYKEVARDQGLDFVDPYSLIK